MRAPSRLRRHGGPRPRGFTLIELLVALMLMALMSAMAWQGVDAVVRSREITQARMERLLRLQSVMAQWEADLREIADSQVVPGMNFDGATLRLTRRRPDGMQVVAWTLRGGTLWRWSAPVATTMDALQEAWMRSYQLLGSEAGTLAMLQGVEQWQLHVFHISSNSWSNAQSSGDVATPQGGATPDPAAAAPPEGGASRGPGGPPLAPPVESGSVQPAAVVNQVHDALPDGLRVMLRFGENGTASGTLTRDLRLIHP
ncbi:PulJ/GspJ family protein [Sphaerotilus uruguayifluvii]|uniref:General secretion pathway protein J n=1 Tax=Sphaerotilus uruguayifluvii TaxID=2735897 RepID=A0ABX2G3M1_9BURK|nr:prepilin-type N-terminal cleavage/methylation domain-containing protein [Leptothrix sp. C29]NRT56906.1 general secretion pathway protein J [Leptothrix sp. C29]